MEQVYDIKPILDEEELLLLEKLIESYEKYMTPSKIRTSLTKVTDTVTKYVPQQVKDFSENVKHEILDQNIMKEVLLAAGKGFKVMEEQAASFALNKDSIVKKINEIDPAINSFENICCTRSYNIRKIISRSRIQDNATAFLQGVATGVPGFVGIPFNIVTSLFLYFRGVQNIAMHYGYDVKDDISELSFASQTLMLALSKNDSSNNPVSTYISKMMVQTKVTDLKMD